jgi:hypothetical protein
METVDVSPSKPAVFWKTKWFMWTMIGVAAVLLVVAIAVPVALMAGGGAKDDKGGKKGPEALKKKVAQFEQQCKTFYEQKGQLDFTNAAKSKDILDAVANFNKDADAKKALTVPAAHQALHKRLVELANDTVSRDLLAANWGKPAHTPVPKAARDAVNKYNDLLPDAPKWIREHPEEATGTLPALKAKIGTCTDAVNCFLDEPCIKELAGYGKARADFVGEFPANKQAIAGTIWDETRDDLDFIRDNTKSLADRTNRANALKHAGPTAMAYVKATYLPAPAPNAFGDRDWQTHPFDIALQADRDLVAGFNGGPTDCAQASAKKMAAPATLQALKAAIAAYNDDPAVLITAPNLQAISHLKTIADIQNFIVLKSITDYEAAQGTLRASASQAVYDQCKLDAVKKLIQDVGTAPDTSQDNAHRDAFLAAINKCITDAQGKGIIEKEQILKAPLNVANAAAALTSLHDFLEHYLTWQDNNDIKDGLVKNQANIITQVFQKE